MLMRTSILLFAALLGIVGLAPTERAGAQSYWEMSPYKIHVLLAIDAELDAGTQFGKDLPAALSERSDNFVGAAWQVSVELAKGQTRERILHSLDRLTAADLGTLPDGIDKTIVLAVMRSPRGYRVQAREFDGRTQTRGAIASREVAGRQLVFTAAFEVLWQAFAPLAQIEVDAERNVILRPRAIGLPLRDPSLQMVHAGDLFRPVIRKIDRQGKSTATGIQPIPWTFISVEKVAGMQAACKLHSGLRQSLGRRRGQSEQLAIAVRPTGGSTRLTVVGRGKPPQPLPGYDVYAQVPGEKTTALVGRTDANGEIEIPATDSPVRVLYVKGGGALLARLPMIPGLEPTATAEVADDDGRLALEGYLAAVRDDVVDLVARREILMARIRNRIASGKFDDAEKFFDELRRLPTREQISLTITEEQSRNKSADAAVQAKIDRLATETQQFVRRFLDPRPIDALRTELNEAAKAAASKPPAAEPSASPAAAAPSATPSPAPSPAAATPATPGTTP